jgi:hypothetical protein
MAFQRVQVEIGMTTTALAVARGVVLPQHHHHT